jgi:hypothetical protein
VISQFDNLEPEAWNMRTLFTLATALGLAAPAFAGDGQISDRSLAKFGLAGMKTISDTEGLKIRGQSFVIAGSFTSVNGHVTSSFSFTNGIPAHTFQFGAGVAAGGFAVASAH